MFGGYDSDNFRNDLFFLDLCSSIQTSPKKIFTKLFESTKQRLMSARRTIPRTTDTIPLEEIHRNFTLTSISVENVSSDNVECLLVGRLPIPGQLKPNRASQLNAFVSLLIRTRANEGSDNTLKWDLYPEPMVYHDQVQELIDSNIGTEWIGHTTTYFPQVNVVVVYGGGDNQGPFESEDALWALSLGNNSDANNSEAMKDPVSNKSESKHNNKKDIKVNESIKKSNDLVVGKVKRTAIKWEKVVLKSTTDDIKCMGHATAKYNSYIYIFGGFANAQYMAKVTRFNIGGYDPQTGEPLWKQLLVPESCYPYRQSFENLKENMMTPRVGHSVSAFDKEMFIWGGVANFCLSPNKIYKFNAESFEWHVQEHSGAAPRMRFNHVATKVESSQRLIVISGGLSIENIEGLSAGETLKSEITLSDFWTFDIDSLIWLEIKLPGLAYKSYGHGMVSFGKGKSEILVFGGDTAKMLDNSTGQIDMYYSGMGLNLDPVWRKDNAV